MRIVVSGSTGNTGVSVVKTLSQAGHTVVAITRDKQGKQAKELSTLPGVILKLRHEAFDEPADRAYITFFNSRSQFVDETEFIIDAKKSGVKYIVKLSTFELWMHVYGEPYYARSHLAVEFFLEHGDIPFTCLRANLFNNWLINLGNVAETKQFKSLLEGASVAVVDPNDVGKAAAKLLLLEDPSPHYGKKYMLTGPEDVNNQTIESDLKEILKTDIKFAGNLTNEEIRAGFKALGYPEESLDSMIKAREDFRAGRADRSNTKTSPEIQAIAPPTGTFKDYLRLYFASKGSL